MVFSITRLAVAGIRRCQAKAKDMLDWAIGLFDSRPALDSSFL
jgi:hypothetical protein